MSCGLKLGRDQRSLSLSDGGYLVLCEVLNLCYLHVHMRAYGLVSSQDSP